MKGVARGVALIALLATGTAPLRAQPASPGPVAWQPVGTQRILGSLADGQRIELGRVSFTPAGDATVAFKIDWHTQPGGPFRDHFLSMREFKCIDAAAELSCQVPYPHTNPQTVSLQPSPQQWIWLEHSLLFFFKRPADYGAKLWNGIYYELKATPQGLLGSPKAIDLNQIAAPPARPGTSASAAPYQRAQRDDMPPQARWLRQLIIEP